jgi:hypothetical protein
MNALDKAKALLGKYGSKSTSSKSERQARLAKRKAARAAARKKRQDDDSFSMSDSDDSPKPKTRNKKAARAAPVLSKTKKKAPVPIPVVASDDGTDISFSEDEVPKKKSRNTLRESDEFSDDQPHLALAKTFNRKMLKKEKYGVMKSISQLDLRPMKESELLEIGKNFFVFPFGITPNH